MIRINVGELFLQLKADSSQLVTGLDQAQGKVTKSADAMAAKLAGIGKTMTIVGGVVTAAFGAIIMKTTQLGDTYDKMSKRTNIAVEDLSALGYAAKISGADLDTVEKSLRYLARGMNDAAMGVGEAKEAFEELNISVTDTAGNLRPTMDVLKEAATKLAAMTDETKQVALATDIFGARYGTQLLPMLKEGGAGIEALMKKAKELGIVMSTEAAAKAAEFNDRLTDLKESFGAAGRSIGEMLIPPLTKLAEKAIEIIQKIKDWAEAHKPLVEIIVKVGATLGVLAAVGGPILLAVAAFMKMKGAISAVVGAMKLLGTVSSGPIGILILAVGALYTAWQTNLFGMKDITEEVFTSIKGNFVDLQNTLGGGGGGAGAFFDEIAEAGEKANEVISLTAEVTGKMGAGIKAAAKTFKDLGKEVTNAYIKLQNEFLPAMQAVEDTIYRLTHTEYETTLRGINMQYESLIEKAKTLGYSEEKLADVLAKLNEAWKLEVAELDKGNEKKDEVIEKNKELAESIEPIIEKTKEATEVTKNLGILGGESFEGFTTQIKHATTALSNFTKEGVAAAIANIKMKFRPMIDSLIADMNTATGIFKQIAEANLNRIRKTMNDQIDVIKYGLDVYNNAMSQMGGSGGGGSFGVPSYATGTPYVPKTGLAMVHKGEEINPPGQRSYDQRKSYSPTVNVTVQGNGNISDIKRAVQEALNESNRQYFRQGKEILLGA